MFDDIEPRKGRADALTALGREDLEVYSVEDLQDRIAVMEAEIHRTRAAVETKRSKKSAADSLFRF